MKGGAHREFAGLARLLGRMLQQFTKHEGRQWPPVFDAVARALAARAAVRDNRPEVALPPSPDQAIGVCQAGGGGGHRWYRCATLRRSRRMRCAAIHRW